MKKLFLMPMIFISFSLSAQNQYQKIQIQYDTDWKYTSKTKDIFQLDFQKASARVQIYGLGEVNSDVAASKLVEIFKGQNMDSKPFAATSQDKITIDKNQVVRMKWKEVMELSSTNSQLITDYTLFLIEHKSEKYYLLLKEFYNNETGSRITKEFEKLVKGIKFL